MAVCELLDKSWKNFGKVGDEVLRRASDATLVK